MADLPVMLKVEGKRCVVVGGGGVAVRRARALRAAGAVVAVVAPTMEQGLEELDVELVRRAFHANDLMDAFLVVIATDDPEVNQHVARCARMTGALVNRADDPELGDLSIPAHEHHGVITLAVHTGGVSATAAAAIRRQLSAALPAHWEPMLVIAAGYRRQIQEACAEPRSRSAQLARLGDEAAVALFKERGAEAYEAFCKSLVTSTPPVPPVPPVSDGVSRATSPRE